MLPKTTFFDVSVMMSMDHESNGSYFSMLLVLFLLRVEVVFVTPVGMPSCLVLLGRTSKLHNSQQYQLGNRKSGPLFTRQALQFGHSPAREPIVEAGQITTKTCLEPLSQWTMKNDQPEAVR